MVRKIIQLTESQAQALEKRAKENGVSVSELVRQGVDQLLSRPTYSDEARKRALAAVGFISDPDVHDLSVNHDKYLAEAYSQ